MSAAAELGELLVRSAGLEFLVTSRTVLGLGAEREYPVPPLPLLPDPASATVGELAAAPAVELFADGWTIDAAARVAGLDEDEALELTEALARHSLIQLDHTDLGPGAGCWKPSGSSSVSGSRTAPTPL